MKTTTDNIIPSAVIAERLSLPVEKIERWRRDLAITICLMPGGWCLNLNREPAISAITSAWENKRNKIYGRGAEHGPR